MYTYVYIILYVYVLCLFNSFTQFPLGYLLISVKYKQNIPTNLKWQPDEIFHHRFPSNRPARPTRRLFYNFYNYFATSANFLRYSPAELFTPLNHSGNQCVVIDTAYGVYKPRVRLRRFIDTVGSIRKKPVLSRYHERNHQAVLSMSKLFLWSHICQI
jgi:hypothetical protein